jgi:2-(1,2-epoxy-1,2-dihydrophenyl)acetyl-CoA isomerase
MADDAAVLERELDRGVLTLTLNRPDSLNALNPAVMRELVEATRNAAVDPEVGVVVLRGAGRGFSSGGDMRSGRLSDTAVRETSAEEFADWLRTNMETARWLHQMPKPTIAMVRGPAAGAGLSLAAACDLRIVSETAVFTTAFAKMGFSGDYGITYFLTRLLGTAKARELMYFSEKIDAAEALRIGLVHRVVKDDALETETLKLARAIADGPRVAFRHMKANLNAAEEGSLEQVFALEAEHLSRCRSTDDHREAVRAFIEKRAPAFTGR